MDLEFIIWSLKNAGPQIRDPIITITVLYLATQASKISKSIIALNEKIAKVIDRVDSHEMRIQVIEGQAKPGP